MACFLVPMAEAIIVSIAKNIADKKEQKALAEEITPKESSSSSKIKQKYTSKTGLTWSRKLSWLNNLLWGGVLTLVIDHLWNGEIVQWPPFLTAMNNPDNIPSILHEISSVGTSMAILVTIVWGIMLFAAEQKAKHVPAKHL